MKRICWETNYNVKMRLLDDNYPEPMVMHISSMDKQAYDYACSQIETILIGVHKDQDEYFNWEYGLQISMKHG